jgi:hypothetical protein
MSENLSVLQELTSFAFAVLDAKKEEDLSRLNDLLRSTAAKLQRAVAAKDTILTHEQLQQKFPNIFSSVRALEQRRQRRKQGDERAAPPSFKLGGRVVYRLKDVEGWIVEQEGLSHMLNIGFGG